MHRATQREENMHKERGENDMKKTQNRWLRLFQRSISLLFAAAVVFSISFAYTRIYGLSCDAPECFEALAIALQDDFELEVAQTIKPGSMPLGHSRLSSAQASQLESELASGMEELLNAYNIDREQVAIVVESLDGSVRYALNEDLPLLAASLYKLPLALLWVDRIEEEKLPMDQGLLYRADMYEDVSVISGRYYPGALIPIDELLETLIVYSDNTSGHILFEHLGGWLEYKQLAAKRWPDHAKVEGFVSMENLTTAGFMNDVLLDLSTHLDTYMSIYEDMLRAQPELYLNRSLERPIAQKYGAYLSQLNSAGLDLEAKTPYAITILVDGGGSEMFMADAAEFVQSLMDA